VTDASEMRSMGKMRLLIAIASAAVVSLPLTAAPATAAGPRDDLRTAVRQMAAARAGSAPLANSGSASRPAPAKPQVALNDRTTSRWGFGSAVLPAPAAEGAYPAGWLFVARRDGRRWTVAFEGDPRFAELAGKASILSADERQVFGATGAAAKAEATVSPSDKRTGMRLPYAVGQSWRMTGGPHPMNGTIRSSIDLAGGDGRVLAARGGLAYTMCGSGRGWIRVVHDRGFATDYYHLSGNIKPNGKRVTEGEFLGKIGTDVSCGGSATGPHVHFSLRRDNAYVPIDRYAFGKWVITAAGGSYDGNAYHGSKRVGVDGTLYNYGVLGFTQGVVDTDGGRVLNKRKGPGTSYAKTGTVADGATVTVSCSKRGTTHVGRNNYSTNLWNKLSDGTWVSDAYLWTGIGDPVNGLCP